MSAENPFPIIDGHNDTLLRMASSEDGEERDFFVRSERGQLDLPRALDTFKAMALK